MSAAQPSLSVAVIGGGLSGLTAALLCAEQGASVEVFEAAARFGGQLWSERCGEFLVEHGAEGFIARSEAVPRLAERVGLGARLCDQVEHRSYGFRAGTLSELEPGAAAQFLGFQVPTEELGRGIRSFAGGMGELADALTGAAAARARLHASHPVERVERAPNGWRLIHASAAPSSVYDAVVVASPAVAAARLLQTEFGADAAALATSPTLSNVSVSLAYAREQIAHSLAGTGFVVASESQRQGFRACAFCSSKFANRAPAEGALLRLFFRPAAEDGALAERGWIERAEARLTEVIPVRGAPVGAWVARWPAALPVFDAAQRTRVEKAENALAGSGIWLAGSAFHGAGIDAAVRSAERAAASVTTMKPRAEAH